MRENLKQARLDHNMTQKQVARILGITEQYYQSIEYGNRLGGIELWDRLEELFNVHQRTLREIV